MKNVIKTIITTILTAAIVVTGINVDTTTATAKTTKGGEFKNGGSITIKPGDILKLTVTDTNRIFPNSDKLDYDVVCKYRWSSSDKNILNVETDFYDEKEGYTECVTLIGVGSGTATVTGKVIGGWQPDLTMTVNVTLPKATAKQKKCKHAFRTDTVVTCEHAGIKICKKCKYKKEIKKVNHKYVTKNIISIEYDYYTTTVYCGNCQFTCTTKWDKDGNIAPDSDYPSVDAAIDAMEQHIVSVPHAEIIANGIIAWGNWLISAGYAPYGPERQVTKRIKMCKWCDKEKNPEKTIGEKIEEKMEQNNS